MRTASPIHRSMSLVEWVILAALSVSWGSSFFFNGLTVKTLPTFTIVLVRVGLATFFLVAIASAMRLRPPNSRTIWTSFFVMGLLNNALPFSLIVWGQVQITSGLASILNTTTTLSGVIIAHFLTFDEKMTGTRLAGVLIGILGVTAMVGPGVFDAVKSHLVAQFAVLAGSVCYAFAAVYGRRFIRMGVPPLVAATGQLAAASLFMIPVALWADRPWTISTPGLMTWMAVLGLGASTALTYILYFRMLATAGATNLLLVTFLVPVSAIILGILFLGEHLDARDLVGMGLIGVGLAVVDGRVAHLIWHLASR